MDAAQEVKERLNIEDVIGEYVELKRAGRNFKGLSPFTSERSPSFIVSPEKQIWHDFSSGKGGDMFSFVMEVEGLDFKATLELLARKAGVDLEQFRSGRSSGNAKLKERLYEILELATKFYQVQFSKNAAALEYILNKRQFSKQTALDWQLGYAPNGGNALVDFLKSKKFTDDEIKRAGLSARGYRGVSDMFRGRIMIPLADPQGRVIGFTARLLIDDKNAPKYINTPQTLLYDKSRHVFGLHLAKEAIRKNNYVVVTEGNLDVIASYQAGVRQVVATAGTALTEHHLKALSRFTGDIRLCFDADKAGIAATERSIPIASKVGVSLSIVTIPSGKDPDELIKQDPTIWQKIIEKNTYALDWLIERYQKLLDLSSAQGKRQFSDVLLKVVRDLADPVEQEHYVGHIAQIIDVSREALQRKMKGEKPAFVRQKAPTRQTPAAFDKAQAELIKTQHHLLALTFKQVVLREYLQPLQADMFIQDSAREFFKFLQANPDFFGTEESFPDGQVLHSSAMQGKSEQQTEAYRAYDGGAAELLTPQRAENPGRVLGFAQKQDRVVQNLQEYAKILVLQYEELYSDLDITDLRYEAVRLQARLIEQYVRTQKQRLSMQLQSATDAEAQDLLTQAKALDKLLNQAKET